MLSSPKIMKTEKSLMRIIKTGIFDHINKQNLYVKIF